MMNRIRVTNKTLTVTAVIGSFLILVMLTVNSLQASKQTATATNDAVSAVSSFYLEAMADRRAKTITNLINNNFEHMEKAISIFADEGITSQDELRNNIGKIKSLLSLSRFALVDEDNIVYTQYTTYTGGSRHEFLNSEKMDDRVISTVYLYGSSKELCLAVPANNLTAMGKRFKACFVQIDIRDIVNLLAFEDEGRTNFGIYSKNGGNLSGTELGPYISKRNIFDATKDRVDEDSWESFRENFANEAEGSLAVKFNDTVETISYVPIPEAEWEMVVMIQESVIHDQIKAISDKSMQIRKNQIIITFIAVFLFALVLMIQISLISREKLEAEKENSKNALRMANMDSMTGVRNKHAYSEAETALNEQISAKEAGGLAVLVCDINGLKYVNDTQGHEAGDKLIKDACALICDYFKNGSVFRVGGDEFVVLLQGKGFETMKETIGSFNKKAEENIKGNGVVVSLGYGVLEPGDERLSDVFGRADQMMYERKKELKGMGAKTRE